MAKDFWNNRNIKLAVGGAALGLVYGIALRCALQFFPNSSAFAVMSISFIAFVPLAIGFVAVFVAERQVQQPIWLWFILPWITMLACEVAMALALLEGLICIVMLTPIAMIASSLGGVAGGLVARFATGKAKNTSVACVLFFPIILSPLEPHFLAQKQLRVVETVIDVRATPEIVWQNIERVPRISPPELKPSWSHRIGFPSPVEATLSFAGLGGVRHASFERGVLFIETIDVWEPQDRLGFSIRAQGSQIPRTTLDEHVTVGGNYFDVLHGEYRLEPLANGITRIHLSSEHRLSTDFNWYAHWWTDAVMADVQNTILLVVRDRCETASRNSVTTKNGM